MDRRNAIAALASLAVAAMCREVEGQQQGKTWRIGFLYAASRQSLVESGRYAGFLHRLRELGYAEGENLIVEWRFADGDYGRLPGFAAELVRLKVDLIVAAPSPAIRAAKQATSSIPIVFASTGDPVGSGFAESLSQPGGNLTGLANLNLDLSPKLLEYLLMMHKVSHIAVLSNPGSSTEPAILRSLFSEAERLRLKVFSVKARTPEEIETGFGAMKKNGADAVIIVLDALMTQQQHEIAQLAVRHRLPSITMGTEYAELGGLMSYGQNLTENYERAGNYVDKILKGAKPAVLPIEQATKLSLVVNRKTAKALGLSIPNELLQHADKVID